MSEPDASQLQKQMLEAVHRAWLQSEVRAASLVPSGEWMRLIEPLDRQGTALDSDYYQKLHDEEPGYQTNNWLAEYADDLAQSKPQTVLEIGTGNGRFASRIAARVPHVIALDWARAPGIDGLPTNVTFMQRSVLAGSLPPCDLACSADVLEHFTPADLRSLLPLLKEASDNQYHVIACYDDRHSHLTVMPPAGWLALFLGFFPDARLSNAHCRRGSARQVVCTVSTGRAGSAA